MAPHRHAVLLMAALLMAPAAMAAGAAGRRGLAQVMPTATAAPARTATARTTAAAAAPKKDADGARLACYQTYVKNSKGEDVQVAAVSVLSRAQFSGVQSSVASQGEAACMRARVKCAPGYNVALCTQSEIDRQVWRWAYMTTTKPVCAYYSGEAVKAGVAKDVYCCSTDNCNLDPMLDSRTKIMAFND